MKTNTLESLIPIFNVVHNSKYDYSKSIYINNYSKIEIICSTHGSFWQTPKNHKRSGCKSCADFEKKNHNFIVMAQEIHDNKYNYSQVIYINQWESVLIGCPKHGYFLQTPKQHLNGSGCRLCYNEKAGQCNFKGQEDFISEISKIHDYKYDYSKVEYIGQAYKIEIICPIHGPFFQKAQSHWYGHGCRKCNKSISKSETAWLDSLNIPNDKNYRNVTIQSENTKYNVDAVYNGVIYEFYGDYWHGNPIIYKSDDMNTTVKKPFGELYNRTIQRENELNNLGYNIISIWESDWKELKKTL